MSKEFLKERKNAKYIATANKQQKQINYFIQSKIQEDVTREYIEQWANRKYATNDYFLSWVKSVFKDANFLTFFKHLRHPLPSAEILNNEIKPQLKRVFFAEDSHFNYTIRGKSQETPEELKAEKFNEKIFNALFNRFNDVVIVDLNDVNSPYRYFIEIDDVLSIEEDEDGNITKIAFEAENQDGKEGYLYIDDKSYIFYDENYNLASETPHDLGICPADYVVNESFCDKPVIKKSILSYVKNNFEEYVFLNTLLRVAELNGALPVVTKLKTQDVKKNDDIKGDLNGKEPMAANAISSQQAKIGSDIPKSDPTLQAGTIVNVPLVKKNDGSIDMDVVKNYLNFFYIPTECLEYIKTRVQEIRIGIIQSVVGDYQESNQSAKNELQVSKSYVSKQDRLRDISIILSTLRKNSDLKMLGLKYGINNVSVDISFGTDFFIETEAELMELYKLAPNPIERKNILIRNNQNKNKFNQSKSERNNILYHLLPYAADADFQTALSLELVQDIDKKLQTQFSYFVGLFEAEYGDILEFYKSLNGTDSEKLIYIRNLINTFIT